MRKKASRTSSRKSTAHPAARVPLELNRETIVNLTPDDLTQVATGNQKITCPISTRTQNPAPTTDNNNQ